MISYIGTCDILRWSVDESTKVDGNPIKQFLVPYPEDDDHFPAARVKLVSNDGSSSTILKIYLGDGVWEDGYWGSYIGDNGYWGSCGNQSETGYNTINTAQGEIIGTEVSYPPEVMEALFIMELGYNEWNDEANDFVWRTLAQSNPELYKDLVHQYMYAKLDVGTPSSKAWNPDFYTYNPSVPEPTSGILFLVGTSLMMLKRQKRK